MASEKEILQKNSMVALSGLAHIKDEQLAHVHPGCAVCDLTEHFDTIGTRCYDDVDHTLAQNVAVHASAL